MIPRYSAGAYGAMNADDNGSYVHREDLRGPLVEVLKAFYATADTTEESVGAAEELEELLTGIRRDEA
jgi:hypothetical protein